MTFTVVGELEIVAILRQCKVCGEYKPRDHFEIMNPHTKYWSQPLDRHICAKCRARKQS